MEKVLQDFRKFFNARYEKNPEAWKIEILNVDITDFIKSLPEQSNLIAEISDEDIRSSVPYEKPIGTAQMWKNVGFIRGAKWYRSEIEKRIKETI